MFAFDVFLERIHSLRLARRHTTRAALDSSQVLGSPLLSPSQQLWWLLSPSPLIRLQRSELMMAFQMPSGSATQTLLQSPALQTSLLGVLAPEKVDWVINKVTKL